MAGSLVLNASYEPLGVVPLRRAVVLVLSEKAVVVESAGFVLHSEHRSLEAPSVVRLARYVRVPYRRRVPLSRRAVMDRDAHRCAYCAARADTIDHVLPRSRGGRHEWTNVVAACARCNHGKGDRLLGRDRLVACVACRSSRPPRWRWCWAGRPAIPSWERYLSHTWTDEGVRQAV